MITALRHCVVAAVIAGIAGAPAATRAEQAAPPDHVQGQLIVGYVSPDARDASVDDIKKNGKTRPRGGAPSLPVTAEPVGDTSALVTLRIRRRSVDDAGRSEALKDLEAYAAELRKDPRVRFAHPNWIQHAQVDLSPIPAALKDTLGKDLPRKRQRSATGPNDLIYRLGLHWHYQSPPTGMDAAAAWETIREARDIVVAVLDSGILPDHPDIKDSGNVLPGADFVSATDGDGQPGRDGDPTDPGDRCEEPGQERDANWHGTHVAGTVGAAQTNNEIGIAGVSWAVKVLPIRVLGACGGTTVDISDGIRWAAGLEVAGMPANENKADIINLSLGHDVPCTMEKIGYEIEALEAARKAGVIVVVAAGNDTIDVRGSSPSGCDGVISVAASDLAGKLTGYSNYGDVTLMAPGGVYRDSDLDGYVDAVWSLVAVTDENEYGVKAMSGTSMAAPHVSAAIALVLTRFPELRGKPEAVTALLERTVAPLERGACPQPCGVGMLDLKRMVAEQAETSRN